MEEHAKSPVRVLVLITTPRLAEKAADMFQKGAIPLQYRWNAVGTAPSELIDILGLGSPEKRVLITVLPKPFADGMLKKLKKELRIGAVDSGIAFTLPLNGANNLIVRMLSPLCGDTPPQTEKEEKKQMADADYVLIAAVFNQGYSEEAMDAARGSGARGGTVVSGRRIGDSEAMGFWGMSVQDEKEMLLIVAERADKRKIMQAISDRCGMRSEAKGIVLSMPIDGVIGL